MSPTDAKRGAKRRKNKRGGGAGKAGAPPTPSTGVAHGDPNTIPSMNGETPFTFGVNQRAPYTTGDRCLLCRSERKDIVSQDVGGSQNGTTQSPKSSSALQLPLYVCSDCKRTVEKDDRQPPFDQSLLNQDFLLHMPVGNGSLSQEPIGTGGRLAVGAPTLPAPDLSTPLSADTVCSCEACYERREITAESERESQQLQNHWSEVRYLVRCIYRQTGTSLADDQDQPLDRDKESMKELVDRLCEKDPYQLYQRLEQQAREYVLETKVRLLKHLSAGSKATMAVAQGPPQAHQFISLLLEEYNALCQAARTISSFLLTLENEHLQKFQVTWELHNKHLFENLVFSEPILHNSLPALVAQLRQGTTSHDSYSEDMYRTLLERYHHLDQEMSTVALEWLECEKRIDDYVDEQLLFKVEGQNLTNQRTEPHKSLINRNMSLKTKQRMLKEDAEIFKQKRFFEEPFLSSSKTSLGGDSKFTNTVKQMLSSRLSIPDCPNCNYRRRCTCDDCSLSHILTCGIMDSPMSEDLHLKLPLQAEPVRDYLSEVHPPSMSSGSSGSGSAPGSPITIQQHPRLILPQDGATTFDDEVPPLSAIYPLSGYEDPALVASINGIHRQLGGGDESITLKDKSPRGSSSSSSSSEGDEEEGESGGEPSGQNEALSRGKSDCPPPSYPHTQMEQVHQCECHMCNQGTGDGSPSGLGSTCLPTSRLHTGGHQFFSDKTAAHPAFHLYPHIHGHLPLHNLSHLPRPLLPTLYSTPPLTHSKMLPSTPTSSHTGGKQQMFNPTLPEHVYQSCFSTTGDWDGSLPCPPLKLENLWDTHMMKNWNPSVLLQEPLPGDMLGPPLPDVPLLSPSLDPTLNPHPVPEGKEKKNSAKKKCLFNYQDAFMEASEAVMDTSSAASSVSSTTTTVQSNDVFHNLGKEDHRHTTPIAPRNSPTGLASLPPLSGTSHPSFPSTHLPSIGTQSFPKSASQTPSFMECLSSGEQQTTPVEGLGSGPNSVCSDPDCEGHRCEGNGGCEHQHYEGEESQDDDSSSEHSSSTSTSTNQKEGKYCDCCYCEFFGHGGPPAAPTSRNYAEMREKLRLRLTKRKEEQPKKEELLLERDGVEDHRKVEDLLQFINSADNKPANSSSSKAAKRARHKQKKLEEKARLEAEARELEVQQQFLKEQRRQQQEEEAALKQELLRLQEIQQLRASKKKKRDNKAKEVTKSENPSLVPTTNNPQPLRQTAQSVLEKNLQNGKSQLLHNLIRLTPKEPRIEPESPKNGTSQQPSPKICKERPSESPVLQNGTSPQPEPTLTKAKPKQQTNGPKNNGEATKRPAEIPKDPEPPKATSQTDSKAKQRALEESVTELKRDERSKKQQQNGGKDERNSPVIESLAFEAPQQNGKVPNNESLQPKSKPKKNKKKKSDKLNNSIDDVFLPKDIDLDSVEMDETEREVEYFKRFCLDSARQTRQRLSINWSNFSLKKATFAAH
ncbi:protein FAM193A isoform X2 [Misgurnus anguillicaudatus]|uniref:protein FAM193A isoform X2 n=1 Tax=Misgurnus anguillicaudatus TaxID=75329 RepID=UPI003CCF4DD3